MLAALRGGAARRQELALAPLGSIRSTTQILHGAIAIYSQYLYLRYVYALVEDSPSLTMMERGGHISMRPIFS
jgi:hypothetical protein